MEMTLLYDAYIHLRGPTALIRPLSERRLSMSILKLRRLWEIAAGPFVFLLALWLLKPFFPKAESAAIGLTLWMAFWWVLRPVHIAVTAFLPIVVNAFFGLIPMSHVVSEYFSDIVVLLLGSDLICLTWTTTGLDRRISIKALGRIGSSMKQQIFVWLTASAILSIFLPNVVVAAIFCPIAAAMLKASGEMDPTKSLTAAPILLSIGWGSGIGGFGSPIGSSANLVAISYIESLTGKEFMYGEWVIRFLPLLACIILVNLLFLFHLRFPSSLDSGTKEYFVTLYKQFGPMKRGEIISLLLFSAATLLAFLRPLFADLLPDLKPAYIFLTCGLLLFFLPDEKNQPMLTWQYAEAHAMWGMMFLFASGMALGKILIETGAVSRLSAFLAETPLSGGFTAMLLVCAFSSLFSEISSNTAAASVSIPIVISLTQALGLPPAPYIIAAIVAANSAYILPISTRAIPVSYGLSPAFQIQQGAKLTAISIFTIAALMTLAAHFFPTYSHF